MSGLKKYLLFSSILFVYLILGFAVRAQAATKTWDGSTNSNWSEGTNWAGDVAPVANDALVFPVGASNTVNNNDLTADTSFASLTISSTGYILSGHAITLAGDLTVSQNATTTLPIILSDAVHNVVVSAGKTLELNGVTSGLGSITNGGAGVLDLGGANTFEGGFVQSAGTTNVGNATALGIGGLTMAGGTFDGGSNNFNIVGDISCGAGTLKLSSATTTISGNITWTGDGSACFANDHYKVDFNSSNAQRLYSLTDSPDTTAFSFGSLTHSGLGTITLDSPADSTLGSLVVDNALINSTGVFNFTTVSVSAGSFVNNGTVLIGGLSMGQLLPTTLVSGRSSLVQYLSAGALKDWSYNDLQLSADDHGDDNEPIDAVSTLPGDLTLTGSLTIDDYNVLDTGGHNLNVGGNWINHNGNDGFIAGSKTVTLDGTDQTLTGTTTFNNLTKLATSTVLTLTFPASATTTVGGLLTLHGVDGSNRLNLVSSNPGTRWGLTANGTFGINYANVRDSDASLGSRVTTTNTINGGHNLNWQTTAPTVSNLGPAGLVDSSWTNIDRPTLTFTTAADNGVDPVAYELQVATTTSFAHPVYSATSTYNLNNIGSISTTTSALADDSYFWRVRVGDGNATSSWLVASSSGAAAFKVDVTAPVLTSGTISFTNVSTSSITATSSGFTDAGSGLAALPYNYHATSTAGSYDHSSGFISAPVTLSDLTASSTYHFEVGVKDLAGNIATSTIFSTTTLAVASVTHTITATAGDHGTISPSGDVAVTNGNDQAFTFTPTDGYQVASVTVDGDSKATTLPYTFTDVTGTHTIAVAFEAIPAAPIIPEPEPTPIPVPVHHSSGSVIRSPVIDRAVLVAQLQTQLRSLMIQLIQMLMEQLRQLQQVR